MTTIDEHEASIAALVSVAATRVPSVSCAVDAASVAAHPRRYGARMLAADVIATSPVPRFDNAQMDGFAVRSDDLTTASDDAPVTLRVGTPIAAGDAPGPLPPHTARAIMTGAPIPHGADAVISIEHTPQGSFDIAELLFTAPPPSGQFVRRQAADVASDAILARAGEPLRIAQLGAFASAGVATIALRRRLRVLVVTTGRELAPVDNTPLAPGAIPDAISGMLCAAIARAGARARGIRCPNDDPAAFTQVLESERSWADLIITIGGISKGAYEVVRLALEPHGVLFTQLPLQPGGPQGFGVLPASGDKEQTPVLCFPGNPVSALISFEAFLRAPLRRASGLTPAERPRRVVRLTEALDSPNDKLQLRRGVLVGADAVRPMGGPGSHLIAHYGAANAIIHVPLGRSRLEAGAETEVWCIDD